MCREFMQYPWALPPSNRSSRLFSCQYLCSKLSLRKVMGGGREVERLFLVLVVAAFLDFAFNLFASLWCRYLGSSTKKYWEELFASCLLCLLLLWACVMYQCCTQRAGVLLLRSLVVNGFLAFLKIEVEKANSSVIYLNCGSRVLQP